MSKSVQFVASMLSYLANYLVGIPCYGDYYQAKMPAKFANKK